MKNHLIYINMFTKNEYYIKSSVNQIFDISIIQIFKINDNYVEQHFTCQSWYAKDLPTK